MTNAYAEVYLDDAMETLGSALEYAVLIGGMDGQKFLDLFAASEISHEFGRGNVKYISGMSGIELCRLIFYKCGIKEPEETELSHIDYPPEYWIGWILAFYQWHSGKSFATICKRLKYDDLYHLYGVLHEADPSKSIKVFDDIMKSQKETNLALLRKNKGLSQSELAEKSNVSVRSIQLYEQRCSNIKNAQYNNLQALSKVLGCEIEDLLE